MIGDAAAGVARALNDSLGTIIHDIQNILRRISSDEDRNERLASETGVDLARMNEYLRRRGAMDLLRDVMASGAQAAETLARFQALKADPAGRRREPVRLGDLADVVTSRFLREARPGGEGRFGAITVERVDEGETPAVSLDAPRIEEAVLALLKHAACALSVQPPGMPRRIRVRTARRERHAVIVVEDNGPGIPPQDLSGVFDPFGGKKGEVKPSTLEMAAACVCVVLDHDGYVSVESKPGAGSRFTIALPVP
jgi:signal transduction histidine kinase